MKERIVNEDKLCAECQTYHPALVPGKTYRIATHDCCLSFSGLVATYVGMDDGHYALVFNEGSLRIGAWDAVGWDIEEVS